MTTLWIGTHPPAGLGTPPGKGEGLWRAELGAGGSLTATQVSTVPAPSFVASHPTLPVMYAISEDAPSALVAFAPSAPDEPLSTIDVGGVDGCHVLIAPDGAALHIALYTSGELVSLPLDPAGIPDASRVRRHAYQGSGPRTDRQESSHAHFSGFAPGGQHLVVVDLGADTLWAHPLDDDGLPGPAHVAATLPGGAGPRHFAVRGELLYVVCELDHMLRTLRWDRATASAQLLTGQPVTLAPHRSGEDVFDAHVEIVAGATGDVLLASVRGADVISVFDLAPEGEARYRAAWDVGCWPRHFAVVADAGGELRVVVAAARDHQVRAYALADVLALPPEAANGDIAELPYTVVAVTSPACIAKG